MVYDNLPRGQKPQPPDPRTPLLMAKARAELAVMAINEALQAPKFRARQVNTARENLRKATEALRRA